MVTRLEEQLGCSVRAVEQSPENCLCQKDKLQLVTLQQALELLAFDASIFGVAKLAR
jgi:hypothetical protein